MGEYAHIIVDISADKLDRPFSYHIPKDLLGKVKVGSFVTFPFGASNALRSGFVIAIDDEPGFDPSKIKDIISIDEKKVDINTHLISLAWWMKQRYGCTMNQALKTVMPVKTKITARQKKVIHRVADKETILSAISAAEKRRASAQLFLLKTLLEEEYVEQSFLSDKCGISASSVNALCGKGIIEVLNEENTDADRAVWQPQNSVKELNDQQKKAVNDIWDDYCSDDKHTWLLQGITGSGKTEVYLELIQRVTKLGKQVIVLIPEISLTPQTVMRFYKRFGNRISTVHSRLPAGEKYREFERALNGEIDIMIGPRSALFTPFKNLGLIIIDEEHEDSYLSEQTPKYNARETAVRRCEMMGGMVILGSATPSMESRFLADKGIYKRALLTVRGNASAVLPRTILVDMRQELKNKNRSILSKVLHEKIQERLDKKEQIMLFVNRRGYSNCISCRSCGKAVMCPHCDISLTLHSDGTLKCHYCGYKTPVMDECPSCGSPYLAGLGFGTEKAVELVAKEFPSARIIRMDMDSTSKAGSHEEILKTFANGEADILLGTQMIVKGHDFSNVTLVGVLIADKSLYASTYKAAEKTFQLLTQAAGRAGRGELPGEVVIQTYRPDHFAIECACLQDYEGFYAREIRYRRSMDYPPVSRMLSILVTSVIEKNAEDAAVKTAEKIRQMKGLTVTGPAPDTIGRINDSYRRMIFVRSKDIDALISLLEKLTDKKYIAGYENVNIECVLT